MSTSEVDFFKLDAQLSDEEKLVRQSVRTFVNERVKPIIADCFEEGRFPFDLIPEMASLGVLGANLPEKYGCAGVNNVAYGFITQELEAGDLCQIVRTRTSEADARQLQVFLKPATQAA